MAGHDHARIRAWRTLELWQATPDQPCSWHLLEELSKQDAAFARELVTGVQRYFRLYDAVALPLLRKPNPKPHVLIGLRLLAHQLFALERVPVHAAINSTVQVSRAIKQESLVSVLNAVGRKLAAMRVREVKPLEYCALGPLENIQQEFHPVARWQRLALPEAFLALQGNKADEELAACLQRSYLCCRWRNEEVQKKFESEHKVLRSEGVWTWLDNIAQIRDSLEQSHCVIQNRSQGFVVELAKISANEMVLDLCAAPGGKTMAARDVGAWVCASDVNLQRLDKIQYSVKSISDAQKSAYVAEAFDVVLCDVPCSNTGVWARRPEAMQRYRKKERRSLKKLQEKIIRHAAKLVRPGGRLVYSTCSIDAAENEGIASGLNGWEIIQSHECWPDQWLAGSYVAVLQRR